MRTNGSLWYLRSTAQGGFNEDGEPIEGVELWSDPIPCAIQTLTNTSKGRYEDGKFNQYSFEVLIEPSNLPVNVALNRVRLRRLGVGLGEYVVQGLLEVTTLDRLKIVV
ncbi:MAG: hypothetical protein LIO91_03750 [Bacteroidales bacterium]|nr:hypothetical protein [Bacteroidales bacterium]